jgi:hypothetical protein
VLLRRLAFAPHRGWRRSAAADPGVGDAVCYVVVLPAVLAGTMSGASGAERRVVVGVAARWDGVRRELGTGIPAGVGARLGAPRLGDVVVGDHRRRARFFDDPVPQLLAARFPPLAGRVLEIDGQLHHGRAL